MIRDFSNDPEDYKNLIGKTLRSPDFFIMGEIIDIEKENDAIWHQDYLYLVTDTGVRELVNKIGPILPTSVVLNVR